MREVVERRHGKAKIKWANWDGPEEWVSLQENPELEAFLTQTEPSISSEQPYEVAALRQAVFQALGAARYTGKGRVGIQSRVSVKVPFPRQVFDDTFGQLGFAGLSISEYITIENVTKAIGYGWSSRNHPTSTQTYVTKSPIHLSYKIPNLMQHSHTNCRR